CCCCACDVDLVDCQCECECCEGACGETIQDCDTETFCSEMKERAEFTDEKSYASGTPSSPLAHQTPQVIPIKVELQKCSDGRPVSPPGHLQTKLLQDVK
uniref:Uncharacterized protein n=1 Tax=Globisporangium ultimum (strain ATCC 200006 / CBS 805.95 / DAOM BR144) TaxID=431595 RepID=K3XC15_GLOUD